MSEKIYCALLVIEIVVGIGAIIFIAHKTWQIWQMIPAGW